MPRRTAAEVIQRVERPLGFNEAGAKCPGERTRRASSEPRRTLASMRPGRNAPENRTSKTHAPAA